MEEIAEQFASESDADVEALLERWNGRPDLLAEDILRAKNLTTDEIEPLKLFRPYQPRIMHAYFYGDAKILNIYKGRRIGVSYVIGICILLEALLKPDTFYPILSKTKGQSNSRISDIKTLIKNAKIDIELEKDNQDEIVLSNGSRIKAYTGDPDSARGEDPPKTVFIDEMAFLEDQSATLDAYLPTISLGSSQMVQVSTPKAPNDEFMEANERGTPDGRNDFGILALKQPTFKNADEIQTDVSLFEQDVEPVRGDFDLMAAETQRASDPNGFAQEYLCRPVSDEYRFFSMPTIEAAMERGGQQDYSYGLRRYDTPNTLVMGVDIGFNSDDTAIVVFEHEGPRRYCRYKEVVNDRVLSQAGITPSSRQNPAAVAERISQVYHSMGVSNVVMDMTGVGQGFHDEVRRRIGRGYTGFNFSAKDKVEKMMGNMNYALHNDLVSLPEDDSLREQLGSIVKQQKEDWQKPKFTGKEHAPEGKDDLAMATVLAAFPPNFKADKSRNLQQREDVTPSVQVDEPQERDGWAGLKISGSSGGGRGYALSHGREKRGYKARNRRRSTERRRRKF
ncbi:large subunit terminase TerL [Halorubrum virus Serpecor1]|uniref:Large subunit terminase TerL n=1 Tax=Halorubrum virus Serpecor1 TaxID=2721757 RepID=A0A6G9RZ73_9CAUD|nr:large subunit terminase TerL [Halorubrum virus Serpecor1]QIR31174.1 large subunit terminase TerL [Halorubrum virus Serpecor1]